MNMDREEYLQKKINPYDPSKVKTVEDALMALEGCSFQGRNLGIALEVLTNMINAPNCLRVLTMSGAMIPAGMEELICQAIERKIIGAITTTGANIIHSIVNHGNLDGHQSHYVGTDKVDDSKLFKLRINRIYDTYLPEEYYRNAADVLYTLLASDFSVKKQHIIIPSKLYAQVGKKLPGRSFLSVAAKHNVPVFCGASSDSEFAMNLARYRLYKGLDIILDEVGEIEVFAKLIRQYPTWGTIIIGGGVPRNWSQQIFPYLDQTRSKDEREYPGYDYSVRFHSATPDDGGLSGCTISESISWGKYSAQAKNQSVWGDATVYFPLIMTALFQRMDRLGIEL
jgi:deoxyhypusine synthase